MKRRLLLLMLIAFSVSTKLIAQTNNPYSSTNALHSASADIQKNPNLPKDYPVFINTGDSERDLLVYKESVDKWIAEHPEEYKASLRTDIVNKADNNIEKTDIPVTQTENSVNVENVNSKFPVGYPSYPNTGDPEKDKISYKEAVSIWASQHPDEYKLLLAAERNAVDANASYAPKTGELDGNNKTFIKKADMQNFSEERRNYILTHPESFNIID